MEIVEGKREGTIKYIYEGYTYHLDKRNNIFRCANRKLTKCTACLVKNNDNFIIKRSHNHDHDSHLSDIIKLKEDMKDMSKETSLRPKEIFDFVCRSNPLVGSHITYSSMRTILHRIRNSCFPPIPNSMAELKDSLLKYEAVKEIYKGHVISTNNEIAIIFSTDILLVALAASTEIYVDGTFSTVPRFPHVAQMYTIHIRYMETNIAAIYILCEKRTKSMYNAIWKKIKELAPDFQKNLQFIMTDYEAAAILSMNENFPQSKIHGCWFHFNQAILRKWRNLGLMQAPTDLLIIAMNIPLLPVNLFPNAYAIMQDLGDSISFQYPNILKFLKYMTDTWLPIADKVSTFGCPVRTNNAVESFHNIAAQKLRKPHANIWIFLDN
ncbi:MULE transposase domain-containing protein [Camponotus japonicus]